MRGGGIRQRQHKLPPLTLTLSPQEAGRGDEVRQHERFKRYP